MSSVPADEAERLSALRALGILGTAPEPHFDAVCRTAQALFGVPIALVSLLDEDRTWFKARCGVDLDGAPREVAFCAHAIVSDDVLVIEDAAEDDRFRANPLVTGKDGLRFYAGAPLTLRTGIRVGTLCLMDTAPRSFSARQARQLHDLAGIVVAHLRLHEAEARARAEALRREQQEAALREATDLLRLAQEAAGAGTWEWDLATGSLRFSPESARLHGLACEAGPVVLTSAQWTALVHPDDTGPAWAEVRRAVETGSTSVIEFRVVRPEGGSPTWVLGLGRVLLDAAGQPCRMVGLNLDITARKLAEAALAEGERRSREVLDTANDAFVAFDTTGTITAWNRAAERIFGWMADEAIGRPLADTIVRPSADAQYAFGMDRFLRMGEASVPGQTLELTAMHKEGRLLPVEVTISTTEVGGAAVFNAFLRDISHRKAREQALQESEARYRRLAEHTSDIIMVRRLGGERIYVSPACLPMLGYTPDEYLPLPRAAFLHQDDVACVEAIYRSLSAEQPRATSLHRLRRKDGRWIWTEVEYTLISDGEEPLVLSAIRNVDARQRQADELRRAKEEVERLLAEAERANRAKGEFLATMSHEIRTPLNGILGYADLLRDEGGLTPDQTRHVERVQQAGAALLTVVNDILDFSKIEAGRVELEPQPFSPQGLIESAVAIVRPLADRKKLGLLVGTGPALPNRLVGDESRLRQVLLNLLNNAVKFTPSGSVTLRVEGQNTTDGLCLLRFVVEDTGIGVPATKRHLLFERFSQVDGTIQRQFGGTGLGLAISQRLVHLMGGEIGVESEEGRGSAFSFQVALPFAPREADVDPVHREAADAPSHAARVLLVEDVEINQELARRVLERAGHLVEVVSDGADAIRAVQAHSYDLVLMDVQMPGMDGVTATRHIRALSHPASRLPIVAMTANVLPSQVAEFRAAGMDDHVGKPFQRKELCAAVLRWAGQRHGQRPDAGPASKTSQEPVLDPATYTGLIELVGEVRVAALLDQFAFELRSRFQSGAEGAGLGQLVADTHAMGSAAGLLGFTGLSEQCRDLEQACLTGGDVRGSLARVLGTRRLVIEEIAVRRRAA